MKTLIVSYLPRKEASNTKKLVDSFVQSMGSHPVERLELSEKVPDLFLPDNLSAYYVRNYMGKKLDATQAKLMARMDEMTRQVKSADVFVIAYPMHNFSFPAVVKAYFDSIMQKGETWDMGEKGYVGLMTGKKVLILVTSGGSYSGDFASFEHAISLGKCECMFMGFNPIEVVSAQGLNQFPDKAASILEKACGEVRALATRWYPK